jgi:hypothetical protein
MVTESISDRREMIRYLDGWAWEGMEGAPRARPVVKTNLIELVEGDDPVENGLGGIFARQGLRLRALEHGLFAVSHEGIGDIGFLEAVGSRVVALYSMLEIKRLAPFVEHLVAGSAELDRVWFSGITFEVLWGLVTRICSPDRYSRLSFRHESVFELSQGSSSPEAGQLQDALTDDPDYGVDDDALAEDPETDFEDTVGGRPERRATTFRLVDRVGEIERHLGKMQALYSPLHAVSQLRFPAATGRGGHDIYHDGRLTNRSDSFRDHRQHVLLLTRIYERMLKATEENAWYSIAESAATPGTFNRLVGSPVVVQFKTPLSDMGFERLVSSMFDPRSSRFRLWGHPIRIGTRRVHVYGLDRHLWQPIYMDLSPEGCTAIVPNGTCGNTIHRLITNIQRFVDPATEAYIGDLSYRQLVEESTADVELADPG